METPDEPKIDTSQLPAGFSEEVAAAWIKAGAEIGWIDPNQLGLFHGAKYFAPYQVNQVKSHFIPAFAFKRLDSNLKLKEHDWTLIINLPRPKVEFSIVFFVQDLPESAIESLAKFQTLSGLEIYPADITNQHVNQIAKLEKLKFLTVGFGYNSIETDSITQLLSLKQLEFLEISGIQRAEIITKRLQNLAQLKVLRLYLDELTKKDVVAVSKLHNLEVLSLASKDLDETWLTDLENFEDLKQIFLENTEVGKNGLKGFDEFQSLKTLNLSGTKVSDNSVDVLLVIASLEFLDLSSCQLSNESKDRLRIGLPNCKIKF